MAFETASVLVMFSEGCKPKCSSNTVYQDEDPGNTVCYTFESTLVHLWRMGCSKPKGSYVRHICTHRQTLLHILDGTPTCHGNHCKARLAVDLAAQRKEEKKGCTCRVRGCRKLGGVSTPASSMTTMTGCTMGWCCCFWWTSLSSDSSSSSACWKPWAGSCSCSYRFASIAHVCMLVSRVPIKSHANSVHVQLFRS